jgi:hypothetical protein
MYRLVTDKIEKIKQQFDDLVSSLPDWFQQALDFAKDNSEGKALPEDLTPALKSLCLNLVVRGAASFQARVSDPCEKSAPQMLGTLASIS